MSPSEIFGFPAPFFPCLISGPFFRLTDSQGSKDLDVVVVYEWNSENV